VPQGLERGADFTTSGEKEEPGKRMMQRRGARIWRGRKNKKGAQKVQAIGSQPKKKGVGYNGKDCGE